MIKFIGSGDISQVSVDSYMAQLHGNYAYFLETAPVQAANLHRTPIFAAEARYILGSVNYWRTQCLCAAPPLSA